MIYDNVQYSFEDDGTKCISIRRDSFTNEEFYLGELTLSFSNECINAIRSFKTALETYKGVSKLATDVTDVYLDWEECYLPEHLSTVGDYIPKAIEREFENADIGNDWFMWDEWCERVLKEIEPPEKPKSGWHQPELPIS
jgi:hypothetical protein